MARSESGTGKSWAKSGANKKTTGIRGTVKTPSKAKPSAKAFAKKLGIK